MPSQAYFGADFYYATADTSAGESPATHPEKWQAIELPADLAPAIAAKALAGLLTGERRFDESNAAEAEAARLLNKQMTEAKSRNAVPRSLPVINFCPS